MRTHGPYVKSLCVCNTCNNGWMSDLERANVPLIGCLMQDLVLSLDPSQKSAISLWAVKTTMTFASVNRRKHNGWFTRDERHQLRCLSLLPTLTFVWLGRFGGTGVIGSTSHTIKYEMSTGGIAHGYACTFLAGRLLLQVFTLHSPGSDEQNQRIAIPLIDGDWERFLVQIYPATSTTIQWPPQDSISGIDSLASRFSMGTEKPIPPRAKP